MFEKSINMDEVLDALDVLEKNGLDTRSVHTDLIVKVSTEGRKEEQKDGE